MVSSPFKGMYLFFCGMCMGAADLIPGISGGTIAFIMGFYFPLLESLKSFNYSTLKLLLSGRWSSFFQITGWKFLVTLVSGMFCSFFLFANFIHYILIHEVYRVYLYSAFLGLILASFYFCIRQIKHWSTKEVLGIVLGAIIAFFLTGSSFSNAHSQGPYAVKMALEYDNNRLLTNYLPESQLLINLSEQTLDGMLAKGVIELNTPLYNNKGDPLGLISDYVIPTKFSFLNSWLIFCGAVAICALLLPGISGSYLFTLLGVYPLIIGSLADWIAHIKHGTFDWDSFEVLLNVAIGIVIGVALFARFLSWLLKTHPGLSLAVLSGFMLGALRSVWPFWSYVYALEPLKLEKGPQLEVINPIWPSNSMEELLLGALFALAGFTLVLFIEMFAERKSQVKYSACRKHD